MRIWIAALVSAAVAGGALAAQQTADYSFRYSYPAEAARIAPLRAWFEAQRARLRAETARDAANARRDAERSHYPFRPYETQTTWKVVASTPRFLSLSGDLYSYTGGAHGNPGSTSLMWDKAARRRVDPKAMFVSPAALEAAIGPAYCARLKAEKRKRTGADMDGSGLFGICPKLKELTLLLGSSNGRAINRIGLIADPYVAGAYAEGAYEVTLPVTPAILRIVNRNYRIGFAVK